MPRYISRIGFNDLMFEKTPAVTYTFGTSSGTATLVGITPPLPGARIVRWWLRKGTVGTGTQTLTAYLVKSGGTSTTSQVSATVSLAIAGTQNTCTVATNQMSPPAYEFVANDVGVDLDIVFTADTTATNAISGVSVGVVWAP